MIRYETNASLTPEQFIRILQAAGLQGRPLNDREAVADMLANANLTITAWDGDNPIGVARSVTDFTYCCYLSDLAVDKACQSKGIGKQLIRETQARLGPKCKLILLSAPAATGYYPKIGMEQHPSAWILSREKLLGD